MILVTVWLFDTTIHHAKAADKGEKVTAIYAPIPIYPYEARVRQQTGSGIAVIMIDPSSGLVTDAVMARSTGVAILDDAALTTFRRWKFRPGTAQLAKIPVTFSMSGQVYTELRVTKSASMADILAPILGKGTLLNGPQPRYPTFPPWTDRQGRGVYELHVAKNGKAEDVKILKSSGDATFDRITVSTLRNWRLSKGPLIVELPLGFRMTPNTYDVYIP